ncbi:nuclear transport factor 2 family protein [Streptomyces sp. NPDC020792]|uniref:nuclear transport factor 2 family protein n=1 Tax=Streptomyces sp. NPDC020792 TaxID=3365089 RepID=UPI003790D5BA
MIDDPARADSMMTEEDLRFLRELKIKDRLHDLEVAYCRGIDRRDPQLLKSIFFEDAFVRLGNMKEGGVDEWVDWIIDDFKPRFENTTHYLLNEWYKVDGESAEGETHRLSYHRFGDPARELIAASRTFNRYEERDGVWKITFREVIRDWIHERPVDQELFAGGFAMELSKPGPEDKSYEVLSMFGRGPLRPE